LVLTSAELARLLAISSRHVGRFAKRGLFPRAGRGRFDAFVCVPAFIKYRDQDTEGSSTIAAEKLKLTTAQRRAIEQRTAAGARKLIGLDEAVGVLYSVVAIYSSQLDGMGGRNCNQLAAETDPAVIKDMLFHETRRIRDAAATEIEALALSAPSRADRAPARSADRG